MVDRGGSAAAAILLAAVVVALVGIAFDFGGAGAQARVAASTRSGPVAQRARELLKVWECVVTRDPNSFTGWRKLAEARIALARAIGEDEQYGMAEGDLRRSLAIWPMEHNIEAQGLLAIATGAQHRFKESLAIATKAIEVDPSATWLLAVRGDAALGMGDYEAATRIFARFVQIAPGFVSWTRLAHLERLNGEESSARRLLERARDSYSGNDPEPAAWVRVQIGILDLERGRLDGARRHFRDALRIAPDYYLAAEHLAETFEIEGEYELARRWLEQAIKVQRSPELLVRLADVEESDGRHEIMRSLVAEARLALESQFAINPVAHLRALSTFLLDYPTVPQDLTRALELAQRDASIRGGIDVEHQLARALRLNGRLAEAERHAEASLVQGFAPAEYWLESARIQSQLGRPNEVKMRIDRAKSINPLAVF